MSSNSLPPEAQATWDKLTTLTQALREHVTLLELARLKSTSLDTAPPYIFEIIRAYEKLRELAEEG